MLRRHRPGLRGTQPGDRASRHGPRARTSASAPEPGHGEVLNGSTPASTHTLSGGGPSRSRFDPSHCGPGRKPPSHGAPQGQPPSRPWGLQFARSPSAVRSMDGLPVRRSCHSPLQLITVATRKRTVFEALPDWARGRQLSSERLRKTRYGLAAPVHRRSRKSAPLSGERDGIPHQPSRIASCPAIPKPALPASREWRICGRSNSTHETPRHLDVPGQPWARAGIRALRGGGMADTPREYFGQGGVAALVHPVPRKMTKQ